MSNLLIITCWDHITPWAFAMYCFSKCTDDKHKGRLLEIIGHMLMYVPDTDEAKCFGMNPLEFASLLHFPPDAIQALQFDMSKLPAHDVATQPKEHEHDQTCKLQ